MSEDNVNPTERDSEAENLDASFKVDAAALSSDESDFARQMGFGGKSEGPVARDELKPTEPAPAHSMDDVNDNDDDPSDESDTTEEITISTDPAEAESGGESASAPQPDPPPASSEWEQIDPRPASEGIQATLESRAETLLDLGKSTSAENDARGTEAHPNTATNSEIASIEQKCVTLQKQLDERETQLANLRASLAAESDAQSLREKEQDELRVELDTLGLERDQLIDQLALTSGKLVQAEGSTEKLEASLRAARGALTPLPEGERALRAEVIGLRGRLEETRQENQGVTDQLSSSATELAIARARVEDRQHELHSQLELVAELETRLTQNEEQLQNTLARHREMIAVTTRLQAENNELRSAQVALEETLEARDLEIVAREEHLTVTRQGLSSRDLQLVDLNQLLDEERHRFEALNADLERSQIDHDQLVEKIAHRESRIATLTQTLARIEEAMGHPIPGPDSAAREMPEAEWSRPTLAPKSVPPKLARANVPKPPVDSIETNAPEESDPAEPSATSLAIDEPKQVETIASPAEIPLEPGEASPSPRILSATPPLPAILSVWRDRRFGELIGEPEGASVHAFLALRLHELLGRPGPQNVYLKSLGGSLPDSEVRLVTSLRDLGVSELHMDVLDSDPAQADARRHKIELAGLGEIIEVSVGDLDCWDADAPCHAILLSDALHSQPNAGAFLDHLGPTLARGAFVLFVDRIASGPLQLSASALIRMEELWALLPESLTRAEGLSSAPHRGEDGGFPVLECDPTKELLQRLEPIVIAGFGHLADLLIGPARGSALSIENDETRQLLESIMAMDESRSLTEGLPPRHGLGVFAHDHAERTEQIGQDWPSAVKSKA